MLDVLREAAVAAGNVAMASFRHGQKTIAEVSYKAGNSPVSTADIAANDVLERMLRQAFPDHGWISEETADDAARLGAERVFIVDPIDGTRAFIAGDPNWSVSVALAVGGIAVSGVVHAPALGLTYAAVAGGGATRNGLPVRCSARSSLADAVLAGPRPLIDRLERAAAVPLRRSPKTPSLALRLVQTGEGLHDAALASEGAHDWDVAAADIFLREAGGVLLDDAGRPLHYNRTQLRWGLLAAGPSALAQACITMLGLHS